MVRRGRRARRLSKHRAGMERREPARDLAPHPVVDRARAHPGVERQPGAADELSSLPLRQLAVHAQRRDPRLPAREARPGTGSRPVPLSVDRRVDGFRDALPSRAHVRPAGRSVRRDGTRGRLRRVRRHSTRRRAPDSDDRRDDGRDADLDVPLLVRGRLADALLLHEDRVATAALSRQRAVRGGGRRDTTRGLRAAEPAPRRLAQGAGKHVRNHPTRRRRAAAVHAARAGDTGAHRPRRRCAGVTTVHNALDEPAIVPEAPTARPPFAPPRWLRDLGRTSWLLVGAVLLLVGFIWLIGATSAIVMPVLAATVVGVAALPLVDSLDRHMPRAAAAAIILVGVFLIAAVIALLVLAGIADQRDAISAQLQDAVARIESWLTG